MASELHTALREIHTAGWYHGDLSPRNVMWRLLTGSSGGVVRTLADVELVVIDFGFSSKLSVTGSAPVNTGHTLPFGTKYFLTESQCRSLTAQSGDFFQALQLVIYLAIMSSGGGSVSDALWNKETDFKGLGSRWLTQSKPWLSFVVTHKANGCDQLIHDIYCKPCSQLFAEDIDVVAQLDTFFCVGDEL